MKKSKSTTAPPGDRDDRRRLENDKLLTWVWPGGLHMRDLPINFISGSKSLAESFHKGEVTPRVVERATVGDEPVILLGDVLLIGRRVGA